MDTKEFEQELIEDIVRVAEERGVEVYNLPRSTYRKYGKHGESWRALDKSWRVTREIVVRRSGLEPDFSFNLLMEDIVRVSLRLEKGVGQLTRDEYCEHGEYGRRYERHGSWTFVKNETLTHMSHPRITPHEWADEDTIAEQTSPIHKYVVTYAQNATDIHENFFASLRSYCEHTGSKLIVIPGRYHNPTSVHTTRDKGHEWWDPRLDPFIDRSEDMVAIADAYNKEGRRVAKLPAANRQELCPSLTVYADISIRPTAVRPLTGFEVFAGPSSGIFGHPKFQLLSIAASERGKTRTLATTGALTLPNYTDSKSGKKGYAHHVLGALAVEVCGDDFFLRQLNATDDGCFIDLDTRYTPLGPEPAERPLALVMGDVHVSRVDSNVVAATMEREDSILSTLNPEKVVYHDLVDFQSRNHHSINNPNERFARMLGEQPDSVENEIFQAIQFVDERTPEGIDPVIIASNHDEAFDKWLITANPNDDPRNARFFHEVRADVLRHYEENREWIPAFELVYRKHGGGRAVFPRRNETFMVGDINCGYHGDKGLNGARASTLSYSKLGVKTVIGHSHSPAILEGCYQVGVSGNLDMGYNSLPSSWMHAHCIIYANSKRSLLFIKGDRWRF